MKVVRDAIENILCLTNLSNASSWSHFILNNYISVGQSFYERDEGSKRCYREDFGATFSNESFIIEFEEELGLR